MLNGRHAPMSAPLCESQKGWGVCRWAFSTLQVLKGQGVWAGVSIQEHSSRSATIFRRARVNSSPCMRTLYGLSGRECHGPHWT